MNLYELSAAELSVLLQSKEVLKLLSATHRIWLLRQRTP